LVTFHTSSKEFSAIYRYYLSINLSEGGEDFSFRPAGHTFVPYQIQYSKFTYRGLALDSQSSGSTLYRLLLGEQEAGLDREVIFGNDNIYVHDISSYGSVVVSASAPDLLRISYY
jgi:hypothetical protein